MRRRKQPALPVQSEIFSLRVTPRLNRGPRIVEDLEVRLTHSPAGSPGQPPGGEVGPIATEPARFRKGNPSESGQKRVFVAVPQHGQNGSKTVLLLLRVSTYRTVFALPAPLRARKQRFCYPWTHSSLPRIAPCEPCSLVRERENPHRHAPCLRWTCPSSKGVSPAR